MSQGRVSDGEGDRPLTPVKRAINKASTGMRSLRQKLQIRNRLARECLAEFFGEYMLILMGTAAVAQVVTNFDQKGTYLSINIGYAAGVLFGIYASVGVSGAHLNPAVTFSLCVLGRFPWKKLPFYTISECLGSFVASATTFTLYYDAIQEFSGGNLTVRGPRGTAGIFATYPVEYLSVRNGFITEVIGTAVLLICVLSVGDAKNAGAPPFIQPLLISVSVLVIGAAMGANTGYAINPARDLGPRLFTFVAGWGTEVFKAGNGWWWIPIVAPLIGGVLGSLAYTLLIDLHHAEPVSAKEEVKDVKAEPQAESEEAAEEPV